MARPSTLLISKSQLEPVDRPGFGSAMFDGLYDTWNSNGFRWSRRDSIIQRPHFEMEWELHFEFFTQATNNAAATMQDTTVQT